jgi:omega-6 fatty acid desaturase (delta-12 desaturase)
VRIFIIFHDCGHGSFFKSRQANTIVGYITGILTFTPYHLWRHRHAVHHATAGDLDRRGVGDVWTMTLEEYIHATWWKKLIYRIYRFPIFMFIIGPLIVFLVNQRFAGKSVKKRERRSVYITNIALLGILILAHFTIGLKAYILVQLPAFWLSTVVGVWLFYVQHQFEGVYWERHENWDYVKAAINGSSFYKLPKVLQWFTGNIGFHHIHHLSPKIPNYLLERCHRDNPIFQVKPVTLWTSLKSLTFRLWDEKNRELVSFRQLKANQIGV